MIRRYRISSILLGVFFLASFSVYIAAASSVVRAVSQSRYSKAHSLGENYVFDPRDGWRSVNATNSLYKSSRNPRSDAINTPSSSPAQIRNGKNVKHALSDFMKPLKIITEGMKAIGKSLEVTITWYTGHDLKNPSCWKNGDWTPTDQSFVCAVTLIGWEGPGCYDFIELCNKALKCVYVRVVDTCEGCTPGSHHIDLTKGPFERLADLDEGILTVNFRQATEPKQWSDDLWGPQVKGHKGKH